MSDIPKLPVIFRGNTKTCVIKASKLHLRHQGGKLVIQIEIDTPDGIRMYPATDEHPDLVKMVVSVKQKAGSETGSFYINEFKQVIVPLNENRVCEYYLAGTYSTPLTYRLPNGKKFSGMAVDENGEPLKPGDDWGNRPRIGMSYILKPNGKDMYYDLPLEPGVIKQVLLSAETSVKDAQALCSKIAFCKSMSGGRIYVNEFGAMFAYDQIKDKFGDFQSYRKAIFNKQ